MNWVDILSWGASGLCILGNIFLICKKVVSALVIWVVADFLWIIFAINTNVYSQVILWSMYLVLGVVAIIKWHKGDQT